MATSKKAIVIVLGLVISILVSASAFLATPRHDEDERQDSVVIDMTAKQWEYNPSVIRVNEGQTVVLRIKSIDVPHGLAIEGFRVNVFLPPGDIVEVRFTASKAGEFLYFCNVFCGTGHPNHKGKLIVEK